MDLEKIFCNIIVKAQPDVLKEMISKNDNLILWTCKKWPITLSVAKFLKPGIQKDMKKINANKVLSMIQKKRHDIHGMLTEPDGYEWFKWMLDYAHWGFNNITELEEQVSYYELPCYY